MARTVITARPERAKSRWPGLHEEHALRARGFGCIAGIDEAGRGAWAGPVSAAAVVLPDSADLAKRLTGVNDSKQLSAARRSVLAQLIKREALAWQVAFATHAEIDALGVLHATRLAMMRAVSALSLAPDALLIDAVKLPALAIPQRVFNFADSISLSVAAASILAKTARDEHMLQLSTCLPGYAFDAHKGYGTRAHQAALKTLGVSIVHRRSYQPIAVLLANMHGIA
jgi:ribonuclease HII